MTKRFRQFSDDMYEESEYHKSNSQSLQEHRKNKRIKNALRARNIDDLLDESGDNYDDYG